MSTLRSIVLVACTIASAEGASRGAPPVYAAQRIGLYGGVYWQSNGSGPIPYNIMQVNAFGPQGFVGGSSQRFSAATQVGQDAWIYDGVTSRVIDLTGPAYLEGGFPVQYRSSTVGAINAQGRAIGTIARHTAGGLASQGSDAWYWDGTTVQIIGLMGSGYEQTPGSPTTRRSISAGGINDAGWVFGGSARWNAGAVTGTDAWLYDGTTTRLIGLVGAGYDYLGSGVVNHWVTASAMNNAGRVVGRSDRHNATGANFGSDGWILDGTTLTTIAMTGGEFETPATGGVRHTTWPLFINDAGQIAGTAGRWNASGVSLGNAAFVWNDGVFQVIDPTANLYSKAVASGGRMRGPTVKAIGPTGIVAGLASRFDSAGNNFGEDVWVFDGTTTRIIGLSGPQYQNPPNVPEDQAWKNSSFVAMNAAGQIAGWTSVNGGSTFAPVAWVYDVGTAVLTPIVTPPASASGVPKAIFPSGGVVGQYTVGQYPDGTGGYAKAMGWTAADGFQDLGALLGNGAAAQGWDHLAVAFGGAAELGSGWPSIVCGYGYMNGVVGTTAFVLRPVVVPASFALVAPADGEAVGTVQPTLNWTASAAATSYIVSVTPAGGSTTTFSTSGTSAVVPTGALANCQHVTWRVVADNLGVQTPSVPATRSFSISSRGDFNHDAASTIQDIFDFLAAWFAGSPSADFDHVNGITIADIFNFLDAWFAGCP